MAFKIESKKREVFKSPERLYNFLTNFHHFHGLLPEDKVADWTCTETTCSFTLIGLSQVNIELSPMTEKERIHYKTAHGSKIPFDLYIEIHPHGDHSMCKVMMEVHMSATLKLFAQRPLENFANTMVDKLEETDF